MKISLLTVVTMILVLLSTSVKSTSVRGGSHGTTIDRSNRNLQEGDGNFDNDTIIGDPLNLSGIGSTCIDTEAVLYKTAKYPERKCDYISKLNTEKMKQKCNKLTEHGKIYNLCPSTCSSVDLGPCTPSKLEIAALKRENADLERRIEDLYTNLAKRDEDRRYRTKTINYLRATNAELEAPLTSKQVVCVEDCRSTYAVAGADGVAGVPGNVRSNCGDSLFEEYPDFCMLRSCLVQC